MRKLEFVQTIQRIVNEIKAKEIVSFLTPLMNRSAAAQIGPDVQSAFAILLFDAQGGYRDLMRDKQTAEILQSLDVTRLYSPENFSQLIAIHRTAGQTPNIYNAAPSFAAFYSLHDFLKWLLAFETTLTKFLGQDDAEPGLPGSKVLELEMVDFDGAGIDIARVQELLSALDDLRMQLSMFLELPESHLKVRYVESGSAIHIHVEGMGEIIDGLRKLVGEIWTRFMNRKFDRIDRRNASIAGEFELIDKIQERIDAGTIPPERGEMLKHQILDDAQRLINSGTIPEDAQAMEPVSKQKLLAEALGVKLLGTGESSDSH
jgi:hypothetical protein